MRMARPRRWRRALAIGACAVVLLAVAVLAARLLRGLPAAQEFLAAYPGTVPPPEWVPEGIPAWVGWQHFLNSFFLLFMITTGLRIRRGTRPAAFWTPRRGLQRVLRPRRIGLDLWLHLSLDLLWVLNGIVFVVLLLATGHWARIVPTSWEFLPNAVSAAFQYLSLEWPHENGWVSYNSLQVLAYAATVFVAAPLAFLSGIRMSPAWPERSRLDRVLPLGFARAVHFPVMIYFVAFVIVHVTLVLTTGVLRNLNHMYAGRNDESWWGLAIFAVSVFVMAGGWAAMHPVVLRAAASLTGTVSR